MSNMKNTPQPLERIYISQGEHAIAQGEHRVIATLLGSCVSACLWDPLKGIGGMNHVLFSDANANAADLFGHAVNGMELLINGLLSQGADRYRLQAKVFGGARMISGLSDAGARNGQFVLDFLSREKIPHVGGNLGGGKARRLEFWPGTGRARMKFVTSPVPEVKPKEVETSDVELF